MPTRRLTPTVRLRRLAAELRSLRASARLSREEVSEQTHINSATLYRIETARVRPQKRTLLTLLDKYGVTDETHRANLVGLAKQSAQLGWLQAFESELREEYAAYISFESEAASIRTYESLIIPGLLQTEAYARAVIAGVAPMASTDEVERRVEARMRRQASLAERTPLRLWAILDEAALRREVGGPAVMAEALDRLASAADEPHVTVQVLPYRIGAHPAMHGSFALMDFPDPADPALIYLEVMACDLFLEEEMDIRRYSAAFEHLRAAALCPADSVRLIREASAIL